ncbi:MAG: ribonuclease P protein component [Patescibacteria group bacterium]
MLPRSWHLVAPSHFTLVYKRGNFKRYPGFVWRQFKTNNPINTKIAVVASKKVTNKAVLRNLYKRRIWAILREFKGNIPPKNWLIVVQITSNIEKMEYGDIKKYIKHAVVG